MRVANKIKKVTASRFPGEVFSFNELGLASEEYSAATKALSRLVADGWLKRSSPGKYYKPIQSPFGELKPSEEELLKPYLFEDGKRVAYITGTALYNKLGLTTQVPRIIQVASRNKRIVTQIGNIKVKSVKSYVDVTEENYLLLGLLDAIKDFKEIPDSDPKNVLLRLRQLLKELNVSNLNQLARFCMDYPPRTRALTGALLEWMGLSEAITEMLLNSLNPLSIYNINLSPGLLPMAEKWNIS